MKLKLFGHYYEHLDCERFMNAFYDFITFINKKKKKMKMTDESDKFTRLWNVYTKIFF